MAQCDWYRGNLSRRVWTFVALFVLVGALTSCKQPEAPKPVQKTFASPEEAGAAFYQAAKSGDQAALLAIFGENSQNVLFSGDAVKDKDTLLGFVGSYDQMHRWREIKAGGRNPLYRAGQLCFSHSPRAESCRPVVLRHGSGQG